MCSITASISSRVAATISVASLSRNLEIRSSDEVVFIDNICPKRNAMFLGFLCNDQGDNVLPLNKTATLNNPVT